jgi:polysaccharide pyruvyl transferase WcaK-like protein
MKKAVVLNDTRTQLHHGCECVMSVIEKQLRMRGVEIVEAAPEGLDWRKNAKVVAAIRHCDLVVVNGEGTIHHGRPAARDLMEAGRFARALDRPAVLLNSSYQANPDDFSGLLQGFAAVWCREGRSAREMNAHGVRAGVVPDLTLAANITINQRPRAGVGVTDSAYARLSLDMYRYARHHNYAFLPALRSRRLEGQFSIIESARDFRFKLRYTLPPLLEHGELTESEYLQVRNRFLRSTIASYMEGLSEQQVVVAARFHSICFCIVTGTPFVALPSNSHKIEGMLEDVGFEPTRFTSNDIFGAPIDARSYEFSEIETDRLIAYLRRAERDTAAMFDDVVRLIS